VYEDYIKYSFRDFVETDESDDVSNGADILFQVKKPDFQTCPEPPREIVGWLERGWDNFKNTEAKYLEELPNGEKFNDSEQRTSVYKQWSASRSVWVDRQLEIDIVRKLFMDLYGVYTDLKNESETKDLMVGSGTLRCDSSGVNHPILLKHVEIKLEAKENILSICDTDRAPELYTSLLTNINNINNNVIKQAEEEIEQNFYHPLDRNNASDFLKKFTHRLSAESKFIPYDEETSDINSKIVVTMNEPVFFVRKKIDGTLKALESIIDNIQQTKEFPLSIGELVSGGKVEVPDHTEARTIEEQLASVNGENASILLSKAANSEQLEIAERIENYNAVLVQGPPGTGKTHTIANLMGHFLAQGKNILVTSHTAKALSVVKEKLPKSIQPLCVFVTGDNNKEMEHSVDGISDFMARHNVHEMKRKAEEAEQQRNYILKKLADIRKKLYKIRYTEYESIVFGGKGYSPKDAAVFVSANSEELSYIPGKVKLYHDLPVTVEELHFLYKCNEDISPADEEELKINLPSPEKFCLPEKFNELCQAFKFANSETIKPEQIDALVKNPDTTNMQRIVDSYIDPLSETEEWGVLAVADGKRGSGYRSRWERLCGLIVDTADFSAASVEKLMGKSFDIEPLLSCDDVIVNKEKMLEILGKGKPSKLLLLLNKSIKDIYDGVKINDVPLATQKDYDSLVTYIELKKKRDETALLWNELVGKYNLDFYSLGDEPESIAVRFVDKMKYYLDWDNNMLPQLKGDIESTGLSFDVLFPFDKLDKEEIQFKKMFDKIVYELPSCLELVRKWERYHKKIQDKENVLKEAESRQNNMLYVLSSSIFNNSLICNSLKCAIENCDNMLYREQYNTLLTLHAKYDTLNKRNEILERIRIVAPHWAEELSHIPKGDICPDNIEDAWKWKQFAGIIDEITAQPFESLQNDNVNLSKKLRECTADLASDKAWCQLLCNTGSDIGMRQALIGWKQTARKIGKGNGKNVPLYRKQAMEQMAQCQKAVPAWIMSISKAMDSFDPVVNKFDIIIIDEASQCDISTLGILYMAEKFIIVGDNQQVSPLAVGTDLDKINALRNIHIKDVNIPNWHLYDAKTSIYDIAQTTFQTLMLREHFRCLPEIIGYSNKLSYDYKIKPLRDSSTAKFLPQVVNYRVFDGERDFRRKINEKEADTIIALIKACIEQDEYAELSFGIISLLGDAQTKLIQRKLLELIPSNIIEERKLLCGNPSHFQGDERDIVFLSLVDSNEGEGLLRMVGEGADTSTKQRYNVAASRAKEQLWVVHSLDYAKDLKEGDMRRDLLAYAENPSAYSQRVEEIEKKSESPFEEAVAKSLVAAGYNVEQQHKVGSSYRIDMVINYGDSKIALECDGESYHSSESEIRNDMERQTILERMGWKFIRIRGSEYYCDSKGTMERVKRELNDYGILPENADNLMEKERSTSALLDRVKIRASQILNDRLNFGDFNIDSDA